MFSRQHQNHSFSKITAQNNYVCILYWSEKANTALYSESIAKIYFFSSQQMSWWDCDRHVVKINMIYLYRWQSLSSYKSQKVNKSYVKTVMLIMNRKVMFWHKFAALWLSVIFCHFMSMHLILSIRREENEWLELVQRCQGPLLLTGINSDWDMNYR